MDANVECQYCHQCQYGESRCICKECQHCRYCNKHKNKYHANDDFCEKTCEICCRECARVCDLCANTYISLCILSIFGIKV